MSKSTAKEMSESNARAKFDYIYVIALMGVTKDIVASVWLSKKDKSADIYDFLVNEMKDENNEHNKWNVFNVIPNNNQTDKIKFIEDSVGVKVAVPEASNRGLDDFNHLLTFSFNNRADKVFLLKEWENYAPDGWYVCDLNDIEWKSIEVDEFSMRNWALRGSQ